MSENQQKLKLNKQPSLGKNEKLKDQMKFLKQQNKLRNLALKLLFGHIDKKIDNLDQSLSTTLEMMKIQIDEQQQIFNKWEEFKEIKMELQAFVQQLKNASGIWIKLLKKGGIDPQGSKFVLNQSITITQVYEQIMEKANQNINIKIREAKKKSTEYSNVQKTEQEFEFQKSYFDETLFQLMAMLLNCIAKQIVVCYEIGKSYITQQTQSIQQLIKGSQIMNSYMLFAMLKQMSRQSYETIKANFQNTFTGESYQVSNQFSRFVQINYQVMQLHYRQSDEGIIFRKQQRTEILHNQTNKIIKMLVKNKLVQMNKPQTKQLYQSRQNNLTEQQKKVADQIMEKTIQSNKDKKQKKSKWKIIDLKDSVKEVYDLFKTNLKQEITADTGEAIENDLMNTVPQSANLGSNLGKCLADIDQYKSANQFFLDLSKNAMIGGSLTIMLDEIPILNYFIIAGGLSYTVYRSYKDQITSSIKKMKQVGQASVIAVGAVGTTVTGMMIGQVLIPVPFLGAFIGGVIGGFIGQKGGRSINSIINNQSLMRLIKYLHQTAIDNKRWEYTDRLLQKLGINQKYFEDSFSPLESQKHAWITSLCFCIVAYYQARRHIQHTQQKLKQKQGKSPKKIKKQNQQQLQSQIQLKDFFENEFDLVGTIDYLTNNEIYLVKQLHKLEVSVRHWIK